jgi:dTDP-4-amino-4,6-dideoxygalactose transaminase
MRKLALLGGTPAFERPLHVGRPNVPNREIFNQLVNDMFDRKWFTNSGPLTKLFQKHLESLLKVRHCIPLCNGTIALELACRALELKGEVIVPSFTFIATAHALKWQEITPVFCDIRESDFTIDSTKIEELITSRTTGIVGVHTYGNPCADMEIERIAQKYNLKVVYDAAHAFMNKVNDFPIGGLGNVSVFSFHATKFFNTFEGGAITTNDDELAEKIRLMMNFGFAGKEKDRVDYIGTNGKMTEICAAMGIAMLNRIHEIRDINERNFNNYTDNLSGIPGITLVQPPEHLTQPNWQYVIVTVNAEQFGISRDTLISVLEAENVLARRYFYPGCHKMKPYVDEFPNKGRILPVTDRVASMVISLPTGESVREDDIKVICNLIREAPKHFPNLYAKE